MSPLVIGLDAGGTKTAALVLAGGAPQRFDGPGAQVLRDGPDATASTLAALVREAAAKSGGAPIGQVAVGLAGAGRSADREAVQRALSAQLDGAPVHVTHDAEIALETAFGTESGAVLLVGTGSLVYGRTHEGEALRAGGWGALLGDDASGTALGRAALRAVLAAYDGGPPTAMAEIAASTCGLETADAIVHAVYSDHQPLASFATVALLGAAQEDWVATSILTRETNALAQQAGWLATRAADTIAHRIAYSGGIATEDVFRVSLDAALTRHLPGWSIAPIVGEPVEAALAMAQRMS
jgi:glucosamine kinase